jgi:hypothetical protein
MHGVGHLGSGGQGGRRGSPVVSAGPGWARRAAAGDDVAVAAFGVIEVEERAQASLHLGMEHAALGTTSANS